MFMGKEDLSDDELDDDQHDMMVAPMPTPQVLSGPGADPSQFRHSQGESQRYNERLARARNAFNTNRPKGPGMVVAQDRPGSARQAPAMNGPPIDMLSQEVEQMQMEERAPNPQLSSGGDAQEREEYRSQAGEETLESRPEAQQQTPGPARAFPGGSAMIDTSDRKAFLMRPGPPGAMVQCYIQRRKTGMARLFPTYEIYLKDGDQFLLAARKRKKNKTSNYLMSLDKDDLGRHTNSFFGKLRSNFIGTEFALFDKGVNPEKLEAEQKAGSNVQVRQEMATVLYKQNVLGSRGPRKMKVMVPTVSEQGQRKVLRPTSASETMLERYKAAKNDNDVQILKNKQPKWNDQVGAYVLNFNGRVTRASVKNFQLCNMARDPDSVIMQFGRVGKDAFTMDYQWPLCGLQAFGIALSSFDYKIACE